MNSKHLLVVGAIALVAAATTPAFADGNVSVAVVAGELKILGDGASNDVEVTFDGAAGSFTVTGRNGTTVNALASASVTGGRAILADLGAGDDRLDLTNIQLRRDLRVRLDEGDDTLTMTSVTIRGRTAIRGGTGSDRIVAQSGSIFRSTLTVVASDGADDVELRDSDFNNRVRIDSGLGNDVVQVLNSDFNSRARLEIETRAGDDEVTLDDDEFDNDVDVDLGKDDDHAVIEDCDCNKEVDFHGSGGDDDMDIRSGNDFRRLPGIHSFEE